MKREKSIGLRILLGIAAVALGLGVQIFGALVDKLLGDPGVVALIFVALGFVVMGYLIYRWAIK